MPRITVLLVGVVLLLPGMGRSPAQSPDLQRNERVVFLAGDLDDTDLISLSANLAAIKQARVLLLDSPQSRPFLKGFLSAYRPNRVVAVGPFEGSEAELGRRLGTPLTAVPAWKGGQPTPLWPLLFPRATGVVVCPAQPRRLLLQAACLAGAAEMPLFTLQGKTGEEDLLRKWIDRWQARHVLAVGSTGEACSRLPNVQLTRLGDEAAVLEDYLQRQLDVGPIRVLVVANPADIQSRERGGMSRLAPWIALQKRAALLLTNEAGDNTVKVVQEALKKPQLRRAESLILVGNLKALPMERRPNPVAGKDAFIEMEPLTPKRASDPFIFATGRLFHEDPAVVALQLARQRLLRRSRSTFRSLVVSNPGGGLPLLETFSRHTAQELKSWGYQTTALFGSDVTRDKVQKALPEQDIFLWEGHYKTLVEEYEMPKWKEPLRPALMFLQSCLALNEAEAQPLLQRGAVAIVGSSTRTYSASGGAFTLAFFDALLYDDQSLGSSLRRAKNFLSAYAELKEKRLGKDAPLSGANLRSSWAFTLWGDPTVKLPRPERPADAPDPVRHRVKGNTIELSLPANTYEKVVSEKYAAKLWPNGRLAGLVIATENDNERHLVPLIFAEVSLPRAAEGAVPQLKGRLSSKNWVFRWDARRRCGYLLVRPPTSWDAKEIRFQVKWDEAAATLSR